MKHFAIITLAALGALLATAPAALAADTICTTYITGPQAIIGNVVVPDGASCLLGWVPPPTTLCCNPPPPPGFGPVSVSGSVTVGHRSNLVVGSQSTIAGNLQANNCGYVELVSESSEVIDGNVQIAKCNGGATPGQPAFLSTGSGSRILGNFQCQNNTGPCVLEGAFVGQYVQVLYNVTPAGSLPSQIDDNQILGSVQVMNNVFPGSPSIIDNNHISGSLQCQSNSPPPTGAGNTVARGKQGQCAGF